MNKIFITSDLHLGHQQDFLYGPRGFNSVEEHDEIIVQNWNSIVGPHDTVYVLGDLILNNNKTGLANLKKLNGHIYYVRGNHDTDVRVKSYADIGLVACGYATVIKYKKQSFYLSHYPTITSNYDVNKPLNTKTINLCGHTHTKDPFEDWSKGLIYHCELDAHENKPILLDDILLDIKRKLDG